MPVLARFLNGFCLRGVLVAALVTCLLPTTSQAAAVAAPHVSAELVSEWARFAPGSNDVALRLVPDPGWHVYWRNPGDTGRATRLAWRLPDGFAAGEIRWPVPEIHRLDDLVNYGYGSETLHLVSISVPQSAVGSNVTLAATADWLVCADTCIPGQAELSLARDIGAARIADIAWVAAFDRTRARLPRAEVLSGTFEVADAQVRIQVRVPEPGPLGEARFFPYAPDLLDHSAAPSVALGADGLRLSQSKSPLLEHVPAEAAGVMIVGNDPARAWQVTLTPGHVRPIEAEAAPNEAPESLSLWWVLLLAMSGGLILNLMPCVFPVLSIKAVSVLEARGREHGHQGRHALAYTAGVLASCVAAASAILALRAGGEALGWGFQLQSPVFVAAMTYLLFALGLSMSGIVEFGTSVMGVGQSLTVRGGYGGSFFTGVLAVVVASPCTAPFMGTALGYALTQPVAVALLVFAMLGLGLALPFLLIGFVPQFARWLPRPGRWMETFKQWMAFPLYLTAAWLVWVLGRQAGIDAVFAVLCGLVLVALACWLLSKTGGISAAARRTAIVAAAALLFHPAINTVQGAAAEFTAWEPYSDARLAELRAQGRPVFVNLTADWCLTCKVNERIAIETDAVRRAMAERSVARLKGDWTRRDEAITRVLQRFDRPGVPLYLMYGPEGDPLVLPQLLTPDTLVEAARSVAPAGSG